MYILNIEDLDDKMFYKCDARQGLYLQHNGFLVIGKKDDIWYFSKTQELLKFLRKGGDKT